MNLNIPLISNASISIPLYESSHIISFEATISESIPSSPFRLKLCIRESFYDFLIFVLSNRIMGVPRRICRPIIEVAQSNADRYFFKDEIFRWSQRGSNNRRNLVETLFTQQQMQPRRCEVLNPRAKTSSCFKTLLCKHGFYLFLALPVECQRNEPNPPIGCTMGHASHHNTHGI